jgi:hypothetical protein
VAVDSALLAPPPPAPPGLYAERKLPWRTVAISLLGAAAVLGVCQILDKARLDTLPPASNVEAMRGAVQYIEWL